jgi:hypothetical protein
MLETAETWPKSGQLWGEQGPRRNRAFEATAVIDAFTALERQLASPQGHTLVSQPARPVPYRRTPAN